MLSPGLALEITIYVLASIHPKNQKNIFIIKNINLKENITK